MGPRFLVEACEERVALGDVEGGAELAVCCGEGSCGVEGIGEGEGEREDGGEEEVGVHVSCVWLGW